jgi:hypothetical protein
MFKRYKKVFKAVLQTSPNYPKDISYRGEGLSNEHRLSLPCGLIGWFEKRYVKKLFNLPKGRV